VNSMGTIRTKKSSKKAQSFEYADAALISRKSKSYVELYHWPWQFKDWQTIDYTFIDTTVLWNRFD